MTKTKTTRTHLRAPKKPPIGEVEPRFAPIVEAFRNCQRNASTLCCVAVKERTLIRGTDV